MFLYKVFTTIVSFMKNAPLSVGRLKVDITAVANDLNAQVRKLNGPEARLNGRCALCGWVFTVL